MYVECTVETLLYHVTKEKPTLLYHSNRTFDPQCYTCMYTMMRCVGGLLVLLCSATPGGSAATALLGVADGLGSAPPDVCAGHRCDSGACPCGCECGDRDDPAVARDARDATARLLAFVEQHQGV